MRVIVLLSAGRHPVSGRPAPVPVETQAIALAARLGATLTGLHAGEADPAVRECLGHGLERLTILRTGPGCDPLPALAAFLAAERPDLVLAGNRGRGGEDGGLLPYALAEALAWPIAADAVGLAADPGGLGVTQGLARGARRRLLLALPAVVTVHPAAPPGLPFAFARARRGRITEQPWVAVRGRDSTAEAHPRRQRPRLIAGGAGGTAADRLRAATEVSAGGRVLLHPSPEAAAAELLAWLRAQGFNRCGNR